MFLVGVLRKDNINVLSISEPIIDGPFGSLIERIIEWMDEYYSIRLSGEVIRGMKEKAFQEGYQLQPPLGYQAVGEGNPFIINEEEYKIVNYMTEQFNARMQKIRSRYQPAKRRDVSSCTHWLSGILKCGHCGASLTFNGVNHSPSFQCYKYAKGLHPVSHSISEKEVIYSAIFAKVHPLLAAYLPACL